MTSITTAARQAMTRALYPSTVRRRLAALRRGGGALLLALHRVLLRGLVRATLEDIERIDEELAALPWERLDHERELARLRQRLAELGG